MGAVDLNKISAVEVLSLVRKGDKLQCPKCMAVLNTIPENWTDGIPLHGVTCPNDQKHFLIYSEPEDATKNMRNLIKDMIKKSP